MRYLILFLALAGAQARTIASIHVEGNSRFQAAAVSSASGLKVGSDASAADLEAACTRLVDTGLFDSVNYRYVPAAGQAKPAIDVTLSVTETAAAKAVRIQIPGVEEESIWTWLAQYEPLVLRTFPASGAAEATYSRAIERFMSEKLGRKNKVVARLVADLGTGKQYSMFRPETLPKVAALRFEGAVQVPPAALEKALGKVAIGSDYTEIEFRDWVNYNLVPLYENAGCFRVSFPRVTVEPNAAGALTVTTKVEEGPVYRLDAFQVAGEELPPGLENLMELKPGDVVNWQTVVEGSRKIESALRNQGYLDVASRLDRTLDDTKHLARVTAGIRKGTQFKMGELRISGLDSQAEARNRARWPLRPGAPLDLKAMRAFRWELPAGSGNRKIESRLVRRPGSDLVDLEYSFR